MEARDNLQSLFVQRMIVQGVGEATDQRASHGPLNQWKRFGVFLDNLDKCLNGTLEADASARSLGFVPSAGLPDVAASGEPVDDPHGHLLRWEKAGFYLVPCEVLGAGIRQTPIKFFLVPLGYGNLIGIGSNTVPDLFKQLQPLLKGEAKNFFQKRLGCHEEIFNESATPRKLPRDA